MPELSIDNASEYNLVTTTINISCASPPNDLIGVILIEIKSPRAGTVSVETTTALQHCVGCFPRTVVWKEGRIISDDSMPPVDQAPMP